MTLSVSVFTLTAVLTLSLFLGVLNFSFWRIQRQDRTPLWLTTWLAVSAVFALCRLLQYASLSEQLYIVVPRVLLTAAYTLAWLGYELGNAFIDFRPPRRERACFILLVTIPIVLLWTTNLILTDQIVIRTVPLGGEFHGVSAGPLYLPVSLLILALGAIAPIRLLRAQNPHQRENRLMAMGYLFIILFSLIDFITVAFNLAWIRLSDYGYLIILIFLSYIQVRRFGQLHKDMDVLVHERTAELRRANETLRTEISERQQAEIALHKSETRYRALMEQSVEAIYMYEAETRYITEVNPAFLKLLGYTAEEARTLTQYDIVAHSRESIDTYNLQLITQGVLDLGPRRWRRKDGTLVDVDVTVGLIRQSKQDTVFAVARDITERKLSEEALTYERNLLRTLIDHIPDYIYIKDAESRFLITNASVARHMGAASTSDLVGRTDWDFYPPERAAQFYAEEQAIIQSGEPLIDHDEPNVDAAGNLKWIMTTKLPMYDSHGQIVGLIGIGHDLTERKQAEEKIQRQNERLKVLREIDTAILAADSVEGIVGAALSHIRELIACRRAAMALIDWATSEVVVFDVSTVGDTSVSKGRRMPLLAFQNMAPSLSNNQPVLINELTELPDPPPLFQALIKEGLHSVCILPLFSHGSPSGAFNLSSEIPGFFDEEKINLGREVANQVAIAMENARLLASEQRRRQEAAVIAEVGRDISASLRLDVVLERIATHAKDLLHAVTSAVYIAEPNRPLLRAIAALGPDTDEIKQDPLQLGEGILGHIAIQKAGEIVNDSAADPRAITIKGTEDISSEHLMAAPVLLENQLTGLIAIWRIGVGQEFKPADLDFLNSLAQQVAVAINNARLFEAEQKRRREADTLRQAAEKITSTLDQEQAIQLILEQLGKVVPYDSVSVQLLGDGYLEIVGGRGWRDQWAVLGRRFPIPGDNPNTIVVLERHPLVLGNAPEAYSEFGKPLHSNIQSWLGVPLIVRDRVIGMFAVDHSQPDFFTDADVQMVSAFAGQAAIAIENSRLLETLEQRVAERTRELADANERLKELDQLKSKFVSDVSHELRTPIANLNLYLNLLETGKREKHTDYMAILRQQAARLTQLIEDILDLSRLEADATSAVSKSFDLNVLAAHVVAAQRASAEAKGLVFNFQPEERLPATRGMATQLLQVITNLVANAINYTRSGSVTVSTRAKDNRVLLQVQDTGMGIDPEDIPHLTERFYRGRRAAQSTTPGTGLGLAIAEEIVEAHGGQIEVVSQEGVGSTFTVSLPITPDEEALND